MDKKYGLWIFDGCEYFWHTRNRDLQETLTYAQRYKQKYPRDLLRVFEMHDGVAGREVHLNIDTMLEYDTTNH